MVVCGGVFELLVGAGRPGPLYVALSFRQVALGWVKKLANHEPLSNPEGKECSSMVFVSSVVPISTSCSESPDCDLGV